MVSDDVILKARALSSGPKDLARSDCELLVAEPFDKTLTQQTGIASRGMVTSEQIAAQGKNAHAIADPTRAKTEC